MTVVSPQSTVLSPELGITAPSPVGVNGYPRPTAADGAGDPARSFGAALLAASAASGAEAGADSGGGAVGGGEPEPIAGGGVLDRRDDGPPPRGGAGRDAAGPNPAGTVSPLGDLLAWALAGAGLAGTASWPAAPPMGTPGGAPVEAALRVAGVTGPQHGRDGEASAREVGGAAAAGLCVPGGDGVGPVPTSAPGFDPGAPRPAGSSWAPGQSLAGTVPSRALGDPSPAPTPPVAAAAAPGVAPHGDGDIPPISGLPGREGVRPPAENAAAFALRPFRASEEPFEGDGRRAPSGLRSAVEAPGPASSAGATNGSVRDLASGLAGDGAPQAARAVGEARERPATPESVANEPQIGALQTPAGSHGAPELSGPVAAPQLRGGPARQVPPGPAGLQAVGNGPAARPKAAGDPVLPAPGSPTHAAPQPNPGSARGPGLPAGGAQPAAAGGGDGVTTGTGDPGDVLLPVSRAGTGVLSADPAATGSFREVLFRADPVLPVPATHTGEASAEPVAGWRTPEDDASGNPRGFATASGTRTSVTAAGREGDTGNRQAVAVRSPGGAGDGRPSDPPWVLSGTLAPGQVATAGNGEAPVAGAPPQDAAPPAEAGAARDVLVGFRREGTGVLEPGPQPSGGGQPSVQPGGEPSPVRPGGEPSPARPRGGQPPDGPGGERPPARSGGRTGEELRLAAGGEADRNPVTAGTTLSRGGLGPGAEEHPDPRGRVRREEHLEGAGPADSAEGSGSRWSASRPGQLSAPERPVGPGEGQAPRADAPTADVGERLARVTRQWLEASGSQGRGIRVVEARFDEAGGELHLRLHPPELGTLRFRLASHEGRLAVAVVADHPDTGWLLQRHSAALHQALEQAGLQLDNFSVNVGPEAFGGHPYPDHGPLPWPPVSSPALGPPAGSAEGPRQGREGWASSNPLASGVVDLRV